MQQIDHRLIKLMVGLIAVFIAFFMQLVSGEALQSISESYHHRGRDWFVGLLFAVGVLFLSFSGENRLERVLSALAGLLAVVVAVAPCDCGRPQAPALSVLHFPAAGGLFAILGYFCWRFRRTALGKTHRYPEAQRRARLYALCLAGMSACGAMALAYAVAQPRLDAAWPNYVFWMEALGLTSFGISWLAASRTLPLITNARERFHITQGCAQDDAG